MPGTTETIALRVLRAALYRADRRVPPLLIRLLYALRRRSAPAVCRILLYHSVGPSLAADDDYPLNVTPAQFAAHLQTIVGDGWRALSLDELVTKLQQRSPLPPRSVVLTFDDGHGNLYDHALPLLQAYGVPATVYLVASCTDGSPLPFLAAYDRFFGQRPSLCAAQIRAMAAEGITLGSHTMTHADLRRCPAAVVGEEIARSKRELEASLGSAIEHFAFPYGGVPCGREWLWEVLRRAGYRTASTTIAGGNDALTHPFALRRTTITRADTAAELRKKLAGAYDWYFNRWRPFVRGMDARLHLYQRSEGLRVEG